MSGSWDNNLDVAEYKGIKFYCQRLTDEVARRLVAYEFPFVDGAEHEDRGRKPRRTTLSAVFLGDDYLTDLGALVAAIDDGKSGKFIHPLMGTWTARISANISHEDSFRDGCTFDLEVIEDGLRTPSTVSFTVATLTEAVQAQQIVVTANGAALPQKTNVSAIRQALADLNSAVDGVISTIDDAVAQVEDAVNEVRARAQDAIDKVRNNQAVLEAYETVREVNKLVDNCQRLGEAATSAFPRVVEQVVEAEQNTAMLAQELYGDATRADELIELNKIRHPGRVPPGTRLRVYEK